MASNSLGGNNYNNDEKGWVRNEDGGRKINEPRKITQSSNDSLRLQDAISSAIKLHEAGNEAFRAGNYELSTNIYEDAAYKLVYLKGLQ